MSFDKMSMEDSENYRSSEISIKEIALEQYRRCCVECSKEMARGGVGVKIFKGIPMKVDIPNQRDVFFRCVKALQIILTPHYIKFDNLKKEMATLSDDVDNVKENAINGFKKYKKDNSGKDIDWESMKDVIKDECESALVQISEKKLIVLSELLKKINYFSEGTNEISLEGFDNED